MSPNDHDWRRAAVYVAGAGIWRVGSQTTYDVKIIVCTAVRSFRPLGSVIWMPINPSMWSFLDHENKRKQTTKGKR
jgi:hypothetical protein